LVLAPQDRVGVVATPVAPLPGDGGPGTEGAVPVTVMKDQIDEEVELLEFLATMYQ
jgi:hypothetical protein